MKFAARLLFFILFFSANELAAQHFNLLKYKNKDGLPGSIINCLYRDSKNYIWLGFQDGGISKFNGREFVSYTGLHTNDVTALCEDNKGNIWIGTSAGLSVFDGKKFTRHQFQGIESEVIYSIIKDKSGIIWMATAQHGLYSFDGKKFQNYTTLNGLPTDSLFSVIQDKDENIWLGTRHYGVCKIDYPSIRTGKLKVTNFIDGIEGSKNVFCLMQDSKSTLWIGSTTNP